MGRSGIALFAVFVALLIFLVGSLPGCSSGSAVHTATYAVPASLTLTPNPYLSLEIGTYQPVTATALSSTKTTITEPISFLSSNTAVVNVANNGLVCAGSWDSLSNPQICTPGGVGVAQVTASAQGVSSPTTTVFVHQHVDQVAVSLLVPPNQPPPTNPCFSVGQTSNYQAAAYSNGVNITSTVGVFTWQTLVANVATLTTADSLLLPGQVEATAKTPGITPLFATIGNVNSVPIYFTTCPVQSISLAVTTSSSTSRTITPTIFDTLGLQITGIPLTWSSSNSGSISVTAGGVATGSSSGGAATIVASCTPPTCNIGFAPSLPIYPENVVNLVVAPTGTTTGTATVYVSSDSCGTTDGCFNMIAPITSPANTVGNFVALAATPNSLVFNGQGSIAYLGTNSGLLGSAGLAVLDASSNTVEQFAGLPGKVLAVAPDGSKVIISDTSPADGPNRVFVFDTATNTSPTFQITGATAAAFSPDSLKAYIVAGSTLYVYSKLDGLRTIALAAPASDVSFLSEGAFAYVAGGAASALSVWRTCDNGRADTVAVPAVPAFITTLPGAAKLLPSDTPATFHMLAVDSPGIDIVSVNTAPSGCTPVVTDGPVSSFSLGHGDFVPKQLIISQDGTTAYVITSNLNSILVFNIPGQAASAIALAGNPMPLNAALTPDGTLLFVGASDGTVHVVSTVAGGDILQIPFPEGLCQDSSGRPFPITCNPDLLAVKP
ncbi:MAG TPA: WD40 repeat domain-containing protein [Terriglobales bacterium]|nr:WD40 repeat domain-containing protein [Terriglobales bacterium]